MDSLSFIWPQRHNEEKWTCRVVLKETVGKTSNIFITMKLSQHSSQDHKDAVSELIKYTSFQPLTNRKD